MMRLPGGAVEPPLEVVVGDVKRHQEQQDKQLEHHWKVLQELREKLDLALAELQELKYPDTTVAVRPMSPMSPSKAPEGKLEDPTKDPEVGLYEVERSMWDGVILLFFEQVNTTDKVILAVGFLLNFILQGLLLLVIFFDMLDNPFTNDQVEEMVKWRVLTGHSNEQFDETTGHPLIYDLCQRTLWSFEQSEYDDMYDYLYKDMPGWLLSILAIISWVLTCAVEYRNTVEQASAIFNLPTIASGGSNGWHYIVREATGSLEIVGVRPGLRAATVFLLTLPRLVVLGWLCIVGCQYLAQTAQLAEIILNAVALAFVFDIDNLLYEVLMPQRLCSMLQRVKPLPCGLLTGRRFLGMTVKDMFRYVLVIGVVIFAGVYYLAPFHSNVEGAAAALCSGKKDFSFDGGTAASPSITLMNSSDWVADCGSLQMDSYMAQYYGIGYNSTVRTIPTVANNYTERKLEAVLAYAMKGCEAGLLLNPQGSCAEVPSALQAHLPDTVTPGANVDPPGCSRFNASAGADACAETSTPPTCTWSWLTYTCEQETLPPGVIAEEACSDDLKDSCETWEEEFRTEHPTLNCDVRDYCMPSNWDCLVMRGDMVVHVLNETAFFLNRTLTESSLQGALVSVTGVHEDDVAITLPTWRRLDDQGSSEELSVSFTLQNMPRTLKPKTVVRSGAKTAEEINQLFFASLGSNDTVETVDFDDYDLLSFEQWMLKFAAPLTDTHDGADEENATSKPPIKLP